MKKLRKIFKALYHYFVPHIHNDYKPHIFREISIASILIVSLIAFAISVTSALIIQTPNGSSIVIRVLVDLTNKHRMESGVLPLIHNPTLDNAAGLKSEDMVSGSYFAHYSPTGVTPWSFFDKAGYVFIFAGENLAINYSQSEDVDNAWMASPLHKKNILDKRFKEIGLATKEGTYQGYPTIFVVQLFGSPALRSTTATSALEAMTEKLAASNRTPQKKLLESPIVRGTETTLGANSSATSSIVASETSTTTQTRIEEPEQASDSDTSLTPVAIATPTTLTYSSWYERGLVSLPRNLQVVYTIVLIILLLSSLTYVFIEIKEEHHPHIIRAVLLVVVISLLMYLNKTFIISHIPFLDFS